VSLYEATTRGFQAACQKPLQPIVVLLITSAPSGNSTTRLRYRTVYPIVRPKPGRTLRFVRIADIGSTAIREASVKTGVGELFRVNRVEHAAIGKVLFVRFPPAAENVFHGQQRQLR